MKLKYIPNVFSILRLLLSIGIIFSAIFVAPFSILTITMFIIAGITDMIDGPLARRIKNGRSELGAILDSIADLAMIVVGIAIFVPAMGLWGFIVVLYIIAISYKLVVPTLVAAIKFKEFISLHTYTFKVLVGLLFSIPIMYFIFYRLDVNAAFFMNVYCLIIGIVAYIFITEEVIIVLATNRPCRDIKSIFSVKKFNRYDGGEKIGNKTPRA